MDLARPMLPERSIIAATRWDAAAGADCVVLITE